MQARYDDVTLTSDDIIREFQQAYLTVHQREPQVTYLHNQWYSVNGEIVHRTTLMTETLQLYELARAQRRQQSVARDKNMLHKLITKLRAL